MSAEMLIWMEVTFNVFYLVVIWGLVITMLRRRHELNPRTRNLADPVIWAFGLLAIGDTGHVGFRVWGYAVGSLDSTIQIGNLELSLVAIGALASAITVTGFYVFMVEAWRRRFNRSYGWFEYFLLACAGLRFILIALPENNWNSVIPVQPWSTLRNIPFAILGLGLAYLILRDARAESDKTFQWIGISILISYACYIPVILFIQQVPMIGMLMIPKTLAYVAIGFLAYKEYYYQPAIRKTDEVGALS